jgi:acetylornithine/succinyldiaminopimelate/putrescine aminotransferase
MTLAKPLAAGLPIGAVLMTERVASSLRPGCHGSTFGGGPVVCRAALEVLERVRQPAVLEDVRQKGERISARLQSMVGIEEVRGRGLLLGVRTRFPASEVVEAAFAHRLLLVPAGKEIVRLLPPFVVGDEEIEEGLSRLGRALRELEQGKAAR